MSLLRLSDLASRPYERPSHSHSARMEVPLHHEREAKLRLAQKAKVELEAVLAWEAELELEARLWEAEPELQAEHQREPVPEKE